MPPVETQYYDLLGVTIDVDGAQLSKAFRKLAIQYHPDKNKSADAEERFKDITKAYKVLADPDLREVYNKYGSSMGNKPNGFNNERFFATLFGRGAFHDYLGDLSFMKEMAANATTTEEEANEKQKEEIKVATDRAKEQLRAKGKHNANKFNEEHRVAVLTTNLIERLAPFVVAQKAKDEEDDEAEVIEFESNTRWEAEELGSVDFGVDLLHVIGEVYFTTATLFLSSKSLLGIPAFFLRIMEKKNFANKVFIALWSSLSADFSTKRLERAQESGSLTGDRLKTLRTAVNTKKILELWQYNRIELIQVLQRVVENVLHEAEIPDVVLKRRAQGLLLMGTIFKSVRDRKAVLGVKRLKRCGDAGALGPGEPGAYIG